MKVAIVDTDIANIGSVRRALEELGADPEVVRDPAGLAGCDRIILPGVGSFSAGMAQLDSRGLSQAIRQQVASGTPLLGICLGMQLLADSGNEGGDCRGLGLVPGRILHMRELGCRERLPHMGWNTASFTGTAGALGHGLPASADFYFVHSYVMVPEDEADIAARCSYGVDFAAIVRRGNVYGAQFHPEKSSAAGSAILRNFLQAPSC